MTWEGATAGANGRDARRMILARMVVEHRLRAEDPLAIPAVGLGRRRDHRAARPGAVSIERAAQLVSA